MDRHAGDAADPDRPRNVHDEIRVVATVAGLSAVGGAIAGAATAAIAAAVLTPTTPMTGGELAVMIVECAAITGFAGGVLGTLAGFGALRRVALGRLILLGTLGTTAGLLCGALAGPWAWHHLGLLGLSGSSLGLVAARERTAIERTAMSAPR